MRYGYDEGLVDFATAEVIPVQDMLDQVVEMVYPDAEALGCTDELERALEIPRRGTSAHMQIETYQDAVNAGVEPAAALCRVVDRLIAETVKDL